MKKRGMETVAFILATAVFVMLSVAAIIWARGYTTEHTESTAKYVEGKMQCNEVIIAAYEEAGCQPLEVENKGTINIEKFAVRLDDASSIESEKLAVQNAISLNIPQGTKKVELLPIIMAGKDLASCTAKKLVIECK